MFSSRVRRSPVVIGFTVLSSLILVVGIILSRAAILRSAPDSSTIGHPSEIAATQGDSVGAASPLPTATPPPHPGEGLVGPEWNIAFGGDINRDGIRDVVAFRWPQFPLDSPIWQQAQTHYPTHSIVSSEIVIVQESSSGSAPQILLRADGSGIIAGSETLVTHPSGAVSGYLLAINESSRVPVSLVPIRTDLSGFEPMVGVYWAHPSNSFQLFAGGQL